MNWLRIQSPTNQAEPLEISIYGQIGRDWWSDDGVAAAEFNEELAKIPKGRKIDLHINSEGGNVWDGLAIYNRLKERSADLTCYVDGICASIATVIMLAAGKVVVPKNALIMVHNASGMVIGNADDMEKMASDLRTHDRSIRSVYLEETGQSITEIKAAMQAETWFTGEEAIDFGLADELKAEVAITNKYDFSRFRHVPESLVQNSANKQSTMKLNLDPQAGPASGGGGIPAALAEPISRPTTSPTPPAPVAVLQSPPVSPTGPTQPGADSSHMRAELDTIKAQLDAERKKRIEGIIDSCIQDGRIFAAQRGYWINSALHDPAVIDMVQTMPERNPLSEPLRPVVEIRSESITDITRHMVTLRAPQAAFARGENVSPRAIGDSAMQAALFHQEHRLKLLPILNVVTNTIAADLKRNVILQEIMRAFALRLLPLSAFSKRFENVPLQGTDKIVVPYFPLHTVASTDWVAANGYVTLLSSQSTKDVTINKRKYQSIEFSSSELNRIPTIDVGQIALMKAEKLASDVFTDVLSVVTAANFGTAGLVSTAALFDHSDVADLKGVADVADWPDTGRSLILSSAYDVMLFKDNSIVGALNFGSSDPIQQGQIRQIYGFNYYMCNKIPANAETLVGFISFPSAILVATAPISPAEEVRKVLSAYEVVTHPQIGVSFEYRKWGNPDFDVSKEIIECNYGYNVGEAAALKRITTT